MGTTITVAEEIEHFRFEPGDFTVLEFTGHEGISQLYHFDIKLISTNLSYDFSEILGQRASLKIWCWQDSDYSRSYYGIISGFRQLGQERFSQNREFGVYQAELVPFMWRLTLNHQSRIFQDKSVPQIIDEVLRNAGFGSDDYRISLQGNYEAINRPPREFCVQYGESDFNFISRLMEEEGIFYFFDNNGSKDVIVISDSNSIYQRTRPKDSIRYEEPERMLPLQEEFIHPLHYQKIVLPKEFMMKDYNFDTPRTNLFVSAQGDQNDNLKIYEYPGRFGVLDRGRNLANIRKEESYSGQVVISGKSNCRSFCSGYKYTLSDHPREDLEREYLLTRVSHHGVQGGEWATEARTSYSNDFECIPSDVPYRPPRVAFRPRIYGTQTAIVVGPQGEEIYVDEKGRIKVQFHWDLDGTYNERSSCWIRVNQRWAGDGWGGMFIPRIGQEVIVQFVEGDPDQPLIVGSVYNGDHQVPYSLPGEKTKATIKSNSSKGGGGFNEIRFEDLKGQEQIFIHAQKDQEVRIENDSKEWVGRDRHFIIKNNQKELVEGDKHLHVKGNYNKKVDGTISVKADMDMQEKVGMKYALDSGQEIHLKSDMNLVIESGVDLTIKVGSNFININSGGIFIKGALVMLNSGGSAGSGAGSNPDPPEEPLEATTARPGRATSFSSAAMALRQAAQNGTPFCIPCQRARQAREARGN